MYTTCDTADSDRLVTPIVGVEFAGLLFTTIARNSFSEKTGGCGVPIRSWQKACHIAVWSAVAEFRTFLTRSHLHMIDKAIGVVDRCHSEVQLATTLSTSGRCYCCFTFKPTKNYCPKVSLIILTTFNSSSSYF